MGCQINLSVLHQEAVFATQILLTFSVMLFCFVQLVHDQPASVYVPILTGLIGYWLPAPSLAKPIETLSSKNLKVSAPKQLEKVEILETSNVIMPRVSSFTYPVTVNSNVSTPNSKKTVFYNTTFKDTENPGFSNIV